MRYLRYLFLAIIGIALLIVALANRGEATLTVLPAELANFAGWNYTATLPMFIIIFASIVAGILIGFVWEWLREYKHRAEASSQRRAREELEREVTALKGPPKKGGEDILALLD
ncbi:MAG: lipopolysaccharide assembly protein LapA domain-containing protein [Pseudomonadota bacterium]